MQQYDSNTIFMVAVMFKRDKLHTTSATEYCRLHHCYSNI